METKAKKNRRSDLIRTGAIKSDHSDLEAEEKGKCERKELKYENSDERAEEKRTFMPKGPSEKWHPEKKGGKMKRRGKDFSLIGNLTRTVRAGGGLDRQKGKGPCDKLQGNSNEEQKINKPTKEREGNIYRRRKTGLRGLERLRKISRNPLYGLIEKKRRKRSGLSTSNLLLQKKTHRFELRVKGKPAEGPYTSQGREIGGALLRR